jgi:hypothetical protein
MSSAAFVALFALSSSSPMKKFLIPLDTFSSRRKIRGVHIGTMMKK